ncbi:uncharacterized protein LOC109826429 [Asparagus officinalis]|uniref:uncharacterized protein LOC109826429 n=1 Tax=Asparagus officinalis TaxID=4686 RepID=UPI00098E853A|nr:uncharacterized protein LOC109826429 [Asparagus officinalis]
MRPPRTGSLLGPLGAANRSVEGHRGSSRLGYSDAGEGGVHFTESVSRLSDGSVASSQSFAFPVLTKDGGKSGSVRIQPEHQRMQSQTAEQQTPKVAGNIGHTAAADPVAPASPPAAESFGETTDQVAARRKQ